MLTMAEVERKHVLETLQSVGNISAAVKALGMSKTNLYHKLKAWGIKTPGLGKPFAILEQAEALREAPIRKFLMLPRTKAELEASKLKCPACHAVVLLPEWGGEPHPPR